MTNVYLLKTFSLISDHVSRTHWSSLGTCGHTNHDASSSSLARLTFERVCGSKTLAPSSLSTKKDMAVRAD